MVGDLMLQPWDTMSLRTADLGLVCVRARAPGLTETPQQSHPLSPLHEPLHWRAKRDPKAQMLSLQSCLREGRVVGPCWEKLKPKGPKGHLHCGADPRDPLLRSERTQGFAAGPVHVRLCRAHS